MKCVFSIEVSLLDDDDYETSDDDEKKKNTNIDSGKPANPL